MSTAPARRQLNPQTVLSQAIGFLAGDVLIAVVAIVIGTTHGADWVIAPAVVGIAVNAWLLQKVFVAYQNEMDQGTAAPIVAWWKARGVFLAYALSIPTLVAIAGAALAMGPNS